MYIDRNLGIGNVIPLYPIQSDQKISGPSDEIGIVIAIIIIGTEKTSSKKNPKT
jgi:hypothetical protein